MFHFQLCFYLIALYYWREGCSRCCPDIQSTINYVMEQLNQIGKINNNACFGSADILAIWIPVASSPLESINDWVCLATAHGLRRVVLHFSTLSVIWPNHWGWDREKPSNWMEMLLNEMINVIVFIPTYVAGAIHVFNWYANVWTTVFIAIL